MNKEEKSQLEEGLQREIQVNDAQRIRLVTKGRFARHAARCFSSWSRCFKKSKRKQKENRNPRTENGEGKMLFSDFYCPYAGMTTIILLKNTVLHPYQKSGYIMIEYQVVREKKNEICQRREQ